MRTSPFPIIISIVLLSGCAAYHPEPLGTQPKLLNQVPHLTVDPHKMPLPELAAHRFDPSDGLDMTEVAMLAVANNPDLKAARDDAQVSRAQVFAAGLLPDPQLSFTQDIPTNNMEGLTTAFNIGLSIDTKAIITRHVRTQAAKADNQAVDLNILWQEWQVVSQARLLFVKAVYMDKVVKVLQENKSLFTERYAKSLKAFERGDTTADAMSANLVALQDADRQLYDAVQQMKQSMYGLNALMGLSPDTRLDLVESASDFTPISSEATDKALADLPRRRPDLLALAEGYQSQEQKVRQAVLEQFPAINIGVTRARDTSGINTIGFGITMSLPVFDRNRGNIAIEEATRQKLHDQYQARLDAATGEISRLRLEQKQLREQLDAVKGALPELERVASIAKEAYEAGNIEVNSYTAMLSALYAKRVEAIGLEESRAEQTVEIQTLMGGEIPDRIAGEKNP